MRHRSRKMLLLMVVCVLLPPGFTLEEPGDLCPLDSCCNTTWDGQALSYCRDHSGSISFPETSPPQILNIPNTQPVTPKQILQSSGTFTLRLLNINVWGLMFSSTFNYILLFRPLFITKNVALLKTTNIVG